MPNRQINNNSIESVKVNNVIAKSVAAKSRWLSGPRSLPDNFFGQTLIEVLISLTLIILFLTGIIIIELYAYKNSDFAQKKSIATKLARQQLDRARVVRDSGGFDALTQWCLSTCYINNELTPIPITPTGIYAQSLIVEPAGDVNSDCPILQTDITPSPWPIIFKVTSNVFWGDITKVPDNNVVISTCLSDWRQ